MPTDPHILAALKNVDDEYKQLGANLARMLADPVLLGNFTLVMTDKNYTQTIDPKLPELKPIDDKRRFFAAFIIQKLQGAFKEGLSYSAFYRELAFLLPYVATDPALTIKEIKTKLAPLIYLMMKFPALKNTQTLTKLAEQIGRHPIDTYLDSLLNELFAPDGDEKAFAGHFKNIKVKLYSQAHLDNVVHQLKKVADQRDPNIVKKNDDEDDDETLATISGTGTATSRKPPKKSPTPRSSSPLTSEELDQSIGKLITYYANRAHQAAFSTYEFTKNKDYILAMNNKLIQLITKRNPDNAAELIKTITQENAILTAKTDPLPAISHFGIEARHSAEIKPIPADQATPSINPPNDYRHTRVDLGNHLEVNIEEKFRPDVSSKPHFVSQTVLPSHLSIDQTKRWARTAVTSFLASAPKDQNTANFEDGLTSLQLAAVISYCDAMDYSYNIGAKQTLRIFAAQLKDSAEGKQLTEGQWKKLINNETVDLDPAVCKSLADKISATAWGTWLTTMNSNHSNVFTSAEWQTWMDNNTDAQRRFPTLVTAERDRLNTVALTQDMAPSIQPPAQNTPLSNRPHFFATLKLSPSSSGSSPPEILEEKKEEVKPT